MKGYKVFNSDWTCRGFQYEVGKTYEEDVKPECCERGFHFCTKAVDCFNYYSFDLNKKVAEVEALGDISINKYDSDSKCSTNKIRIIRELTWDEVFRLVNVGNHCFGYGNTESNNIGDRNSGCYNNGKYNTGNANIGKFNTGSCNTGNCNSGMYNNGNYNTGNHNNGNFNSGDWNNACYSSGCFNTESPKIFMFNKPSNWTYDTWVFSDARRVLRGMPIRCFRWVNEHEMTDDEKKQHPEYSVTDGFLRKTENQEARQEWWDDLCDFERKEVMNLPNFDKNIFKQITGIDVDHKKEQPIYFIFMEDENGNVSED